MLRSQIRYVVFWRYGLILIVLSWLFTCGPSVPAQAPVIVLPSDPDFVGANEAFDTLAWNREPLMPTPRIDFAAATASVSGKPIIFAVGGRSFKITGPINKLEAYDPDPGTNAWSTKTPMPTARFNLGAGTIADGTINERIYVVGGQLGDDDATTTDLVEAYDPATDSWPTTAPTPAPMPTPRAAMGVTVLKRSTPPLRGLLYVIGGVTVSGGSPVATVDAYDPAVGSGGTWASRTAMSTARRNPVVGVVSGKIYAIGGADVDGNAVTAVEEFTQGAGGGSWVTKTDMPIPQLGAAGAVVGDKIYVTGGIEGAVTQTALSLVQVYDPATDMWSLAAPMPTARLNHRAAVANDILFAIGGRFFGVARVDEQFLYKIVALNSPTSYGAAGLPDGLTIDTTLGIIYGTPAGPPGDSTVTLTASKGVDTATQSINLTVLPSIPSTLNPAQAEPAIKSSSSVTGTIDEAFNYQVFVENATGTTVLDAGGTLPPGLTLDPVTGTISGMVTALDDIDGDGWATSQAVLTLKDETLATASETFLQLNFASSDLNIPVIDSPDTIVPDSFTLVPGVLFRYIVTSSPQADNFTLLKTLPPDLSLSFDSLHGQWKVQGVYNPVVNGSISVRGSSESQFYLPSFFRSGDSIDTIRIRPPCLIYDDFTAESTSGSATRPLNFFEATVDARVTYSSGSFDIDLPFLSDPRTSGPGIECRNRGNNHYQIIFAFPAGIQGLPTLVVEPGAGKRARGTLSVSEDGVAVDLLAQDQQIVTLRLRNVNIGSYTYPEVVAQIGILIGDTDGNGTVTTADLPTHGGQVTSINYREDTNADGTVDQRDRSLVTRNRGHTLFPLERLESRQKELAARQADGSP